MSTSNVVKLRKILIEKIFGRGQNYNQCAVEAAIFLYNNMDKSYNKSEIWDAVRDNIDLHGETPRATFEADLTRYTENSDSIDKRNPLLFRIANLNESPYKIQLINTMREKFKNYLEGLRKEDEQEADTFIDGKEDNEDLVNEKESIISNTLKKYWIFQSNPLAYKIEEAIRELKEDNFSVNQYKEEIKEGDKVLFWVSGEEAGIVGFGDILSNPDMMGGSPESEKYIIDPEFKKDKLRVRVSYNPIEPKLLKNDLLSKYPEIFTSELSIIKLPRGTNFPIDEKVWNFVEERFIRNYFIFVLNDDIFEGRESLGRNYKFPDPDKGGYKLIGKSVGSWGPIINNIRVNDKIILTISGGSRRPDKKTFWGYGEITEINNEQKLWKISSTQFSKKLKIDDLIDQWPEDYQNLYKQSTGIINMGYYGVNQIDYFQYNSIINHLFKKEEEETGIQDTDQEDLEKGTLKTDVTETLFFKDQEQISKRVETALNNRNHIILIGPPGTGKSKYAKEICDKRGRDYIMTTATSDWSTFDTIGGYRLNKDNKLEFFPGIFLQCFKDKSGRAINKWLIIDEINRADIDKAFGSLFSALTGDSITLPFEINGKLIELIGRPKDDGNSAENKYVIPKDWHIIATMNTFDKSSLYEMSYAFMRRFAFIPIEVPSDSEIGKDLIDKYVKCWNLEFDEDIAEKITLLWKLINRYRKIGPAIIEDIYKYVKESEIQDYTSALIMYVFPQFEGLSDDILKRFIKEIESESFKYLNKVDVINFFVDFFGIEENILNNNSKNKENTQNSEDLESSEEEQ